MQSRVLLLVAIPVRYIGRLPTILPKIAHKAKSARDGARPHFAGLTLGKWGAGGDAGHLSTAGVAAAQSCSTTFSKEL
jgi:hypothetical protein